MANTFRQVWKWLLPWNIAKPDDLTDEGAAVAHTLATLMDVTLTRAREGLNARFPTRAGPSANELAAADRGLTPGRSETADAFAARLVAWRTPRTHRVRGNAYEAAAQLGAYWGTGNIAVGVIDARGVRHVFGLDGVVTKSTATWNWGDLDPDVYWSRFWVTLEQPADIEFDETPDLGDPALWGGALGTPGYVLGLTGMTPADVLAMRQLFQERNWHPGGTSPEWMVVSFDGSIPDAGADAWSFYDSGDQTQKPLRDSLYRYISLSPRDNNTTDGNPESFALYAFTDALGTYGPGDPENAAAWGAIALPDGTAYTGDPESFPVDVLLLDDGSLPR